jgi:hypothetical protein
MKALVQYEPTQPIFFTCQQIGPCVLYMQRL